MQQGNSEAYAKLLSSITDFGAGKCSLENALKTRFGIRVKYHPYDPAFPEYQEPVPAELICCIEVLEHVEPDHLDAVLTTLQKITLNFGFLTVNTAAAKKFLPDGRNAHLIQEPISWWLSQLSKYFEVQWLSKTSATGFAVLVTGLGDVKRLATPLEMTQTHSVKVHLNSAWVRVRTEIKSRWHGRK
jgi:hypothetical protein